MGLAGNARGDLAVVTGDASHVRTVYVRRAVRLLPVSPAHLGDEPRARCHGRRRSQGRRPRRLGGTSTRSSPATGEPPATPARCTASATACSRSCRPRSTQRPPEVAWKSQRVSEGESNTPAIVRFATAAPGPRLRGPADGRDRRRVGAPAASWARPGAGWSPEGQRAARCWQWTGFDGSHFVVRESEVGRRPSRLAADALAGRRGRRRSGRRDRARRGGRSWRGDRGVQGADPVAGATRRSSLASRRGPRQRASARPSSQRQRARTSPPAPFAALDPGRAGRSCVYAPLGGGVRASARP
jgi:hypothetical protein